MTKEEIIREYRLSVANDIKATLAKMLKEYAELCDGIITEFNTSFKKVEHMLDDEECGVSDDARNNLIQVYKHQELEMIRQATNMYLEQYNDAKTYAVSEKVSELIDWDDYLPLAK